MGLSTGVEVVVGYAYWARAALTRRFAPSLFLAPRVQRSCEPATGALRGERLRGRAAATGKGFDTSVVVNEETNRQHSPTVRFFVISGSPGWT